MSVIYYLAIFLLVRRLQQSFKFSPLRAKWISTFTIVTWGAVGAAILTLGYAESGIGSIIAAVVLFGAVYFSDKEPDFYLLNSYIKAHYPLALAGFLAGFSELIVPKFYQEQNAYFEVPVLGAFIWILARWAATKKQRQEFNLISQQNLMLDKLVAERTGELTRQKNELQETLALLQTTQQQLIQSEKLASLGELTAGIAHEIQNPLNFVNNFSEVNIEMIDELEMELKAGNVDEALALAGNIKQNEEKINHHGKRADGIVKGMLQHSRASSNTREPTDINKLADEYFRLAYHGLRAKDKSFNAGMVTHFEEGLPEINVVPQDIGRVLLNLLTNAFYATSQKQKTAGADYKPTVELRTAIKDKFAEIRVKDNGSGIPDLIKDKIMQPFFTTKPTGQGTGLGLSLSYDIVVKGHGGIIDVSSAEGEYTEFIVKLPL